MPSFAHLPLLFGPDRKRLSKRHGATSVEELREAGYLAEAVVNFLALLGWHFDSERELFTREELVGLFSLERVNPAPAVFDAKKLEWMNGVYLRALPTFDLAERLIAFLRERGSPLAAQPERIVEVDAAGAGEDRDARRVRAALLVPVRPDRDRRGGLGARSPGTSARPRSWPPCRRPSRTASGRVEAVEAALRGVCEQLALKPRVVFGLVRVAVTGTSISPGLFESVHAARPRRDARAARRCRRAPLRPAPLSAARRAGPRAPRARGRRPRRRGPRARRALRARRRPRARARASGRAPGSAASVPSASCAARPATGLPGASVRARSERVRPSAGPAA